jgi:8-oxo-dGTP diphosphatase
MSSTSLKEKSARRRHSAPASNAASGHAREILKIGLAVTALGRLLVVRKKGKKSYILPGGKPEKGEDDLQALSREIEEELGCSLDPQTISYLGSFSDTAADMKGTTVTVRLYAAELIGEPSPRAEIETVKWYSPSVDSGDMLAPSIQNKILPYLRHQKRLEP